MNRLEEAQAKIAALRVSMRREGIDGALVCQQPNFSYLTAGGRGFLGLASVAACGMLLVTRERVFLLANCIEGPRLMREEIPEGLCELCAVPWQEDGTLRQAARKMVEGRLLDDTEMSGYFAAARLVLCDAERTRYLSLGRDSALALENALRETQIGDAECLVAGRISKNLWAAGAEPISLFIAADGRADEVRHYVPTARQARHKVIASICARRGGLVISATRSILLDKTDKTWQNQYAKLLRVECAMLAAVKPGAALSVCYDAAVRAYEAEGMPGEYNRHHQGGVTGYLPREIRMDGTSGMLIQPGQAFAFNPSCPGAKAEDTYLLTEHGLELLSDSGTWNMIAVDGFKRPEILCLGRE